MALRMPSGTIAAALVFLIRESGLFRSVVNGPAFCLGGSHLRLGDDVLLLVVDSADGIENSVSDLWQALYHRIHRLAVNLVQITVQRY